MNRREGEPLWREVVGDTEPWRRGRLFLILLAILTFCLQCFSFWGLVLAGDIQSILGLGIFALLFWLQFYFIWIGVHWVRWLNGAWNGLWGFAFIIWGLRDSAGLVVAVGIYCFATGAYLALAPSVYFFAKRQRESVRWMESLIVAAVFLLLLGSLGAGVFGLLGYKANLEREARRFADTAFNRIFVEHDTYFFLEHASDRLLQDAGGREALTRFMQDATMRAGEVHDIQPPAGRLRFSFLFPSHLGSEGEMVTEGKGDHGRIRMQLIVGEGSGGGWTIHGIRWMYLAPTSAPRSPP
jgi:hypothetical protein